MFDRTTNLDALLGVPEQSHAEERAAKLKALARAYSEQLRPALRAAARSHIAFALEAMKAGEIYAREFTAAGVELKIAAVLTVAPRDVAELARTYIGAGMIDPADELLRSIDFSG